MSVAVVGDLGLVNAGATFDRLHQLVDDNEIDFVMHLGDIGCEKSYTRVLDLGFDACLQRSIDGFVERCVTGVGKDLQPSFGLCWFFLLDSYDASGAVGHSVRLLFDRRGA